ncbi:MAG TPA: hypothetical protein VF198_08405 [Vicinamibacterales bacterium]
MRTTTTLFALALLALGIAACGQSDETIGPVRDPQDLFWDLELNEHAINLSLDQSRPEYYTFQLVATPLRLDGSPLELGPGDTLIFTSSDTNRVRVSADGLVTAKAVTPGSRPVRILARMQAGRGPVTNVDSAFVTVTADVRPVASFDIEAARTTYGVGFDTMMAAHALGPDGQPVTGIGIAYTSSLPKVAGYTADGVFMAMTPGKAILRASTVAYGTPYRDSIEVTVTEPPEVLHVVTEYATLPDGDIVLYFVPNEVTIKVGQGVSWGPGSLGCVYGVVFDDPTNVGPSPVDGASGNLPFLCGAGTRMIRMFYVPGTYEYEAGPTFPTREKARIIVTP